MQSAEIIAVGSELLTPLRTDTNSLFLTGRLNELGISVSGKAVVADDTRALASALRGALERTSLVVTTGGLGPTDDDLTREAVAAVAGVASHEDADVISRIERRFASRGMKMPPSNRRQASIPEGAIVLDNPRGTAPGLWIEVGGKVIVSLPGPPRELEPMFETQVMPRLAERGGRTVLRRRVVRTTGRGESHVDELAQPVYRAWRTLDPPIVTTVLAAPGRVELHLEVQGVDAQGLETQLDAAVAEMCDALGSIVVSVDGRRLEEVVGALLQSRGLMLAAAESCTGGLMLGCVTSVPGSSAWTAGGVVVYANRSKETLLGVPHDLIVANGAVSEEVAAAMAGGVRQRLEASLGVAITGVAGPGGGSDAKPVGTVVFAVAGPDTRQMVRTVRFPGDRAMVRRMAVQTALDLVRRAVADDPLRGI